MWFKADLEKNDLVEIITFLSSYRSLVEISGGCAKIQPVAFFILHNYAN